MTFPSNAHTHSRWCDGADAIPAMVEAARAFGLCEPGILGARPAGLRPGLFHGRRMRRRATLRSFAPCRRAPEPGFPRLWAGLELDALAAHRGPAAARPVPKRITSSARRTTCAKAVAATPVAVDGDPALLRRYVEMAEVYHGDGLAMARDYFAIEVAGPPARPAAHHRPLRPAAQVCRAPLAV